MKIIPPGVPFAQALRAGLVGRLKSDAYRAWVRALPSVVSGAPADDPHHPYEVGFKGGGTKVPDWWCIPLTRAEHEELHRDVGAWEAKHGSQLEHALMTLTRAIAEGVLTWR